MKQENKHTHGASSIAWYKLADLISRKEREKALSIFHLISHSLDNQAYSLQLEGDILWALDDIAGAKERYKNSAFLYQKDKKIIDAIAMYEHLLSLDPDNNEILATLAPLYVSCEWYEQYENTIAHLCGLFNRHKFDETSLLYALTIITDGINSLDLKKKSFAIEKLKGYLANIPLSITQKIII